MTERATCETCRWWDAEWRYQSTEVRRCTRIPEYWDATRWTDDEYETRITCNADDLAFAQDGSDYRAMLLTRAQFGCVLHQRREVADE